MTVATNNNLARRESAEVVAPISTGMDEMERMAKAIAGSRLFGIQTAEQALVLMAICRSEGKDPIQAVKTYHIINGKPAMRADAMLAEFQARGGKIAWGERTNTIVSAVFSHPSSGDVPVTWTIEDAKTAGLLGNPTWTKYPRQMLTARVVSEGIRTALPGVVAGIYTPEEVMQFDDAPMAVPGTPTVPAEPIVHPAPARQHSQMGTAKNAPPPADTNAKAIMRAARDRFDRAAMDLGEDVSTGPLRGKLVCAVLGRPLDNPGEITPGDWDEAAERLPAYIEVLQANAGQEIEGQDSAEPAASPKAPPEMQTAAEKRPDLSDALLDVDDISDPFATDPEPEPVMGYASHESKLVQGKKK